jgi:hypothetical protein
MVNMTSAAAVRNVLVCLALVVSACGGGGEDPGEGDVDAAADGGIRSDGGPATSPNGLPLGDGGAPAVDPQEPQFVPFQRDFQGFETWTKFELGSDEGVGDGVIHTKGKRTIYINRLPAPGSRAFPNGTIIVKTMPTGEILARVRRGGDYNKNGARGWEWFELGKVEDQWVFSWRGITPPAGFCYGGIVGGACNDCHRAFAHNDYVAASVLDLGKL